MLRAARVWNRLWANLFEAPEDDPFTIAVTAGITFFIFVLIGSIASM